MKILLFREFNDELKSYWKCLEARADIHIFQKYEWLEHWSNTIGARVRLTQPLIYLVLDERNLPIALAPFSFRKNYGVKIIEFLGGKQADYQGLIVSRDVFKNCTKFKLIYDEVIKLLPKYDLIHMFGIPELWINSKNSLLSVSNFQKYNVAYRIRLPSSFLEYGDMVGKKFINDNKRQLKRLDAIQKLDFLKYTRIDQCKRMFESFIKQKRMRYKQTGTIDSLANPASQLFYGEATISLIDSKCLHYSAIQIEKKIIATHFGAKNEDIFYYLMPAYDDRYKKYSPGRILGMKLIEYCIEEKIKYFDLGIGDESYKSKWGGMQFGVYEKYEIRSIFGFMYYFAHSIKKYARSNIYVYLIIKSLRKIFKNFHV